MIKYLRYVSSIGIGLLIAIITYCKFSFIPVDNISAIFAGLANNAITLSSILVATLAILMSISGSRLVKRMAQTGHFKNLLTSLLFCILLFLLVHIVCTLALYFPTKNERLFLSISSGLVSFSLFWFINTCRKFYLVLTNLHS